MSGEHLKLTGEERLILVRAKVQRARKHLRDLEAELGAFRDRSMTIASGPRDNQGVVRGPYTLHDLPVIPIDALTAAGDVVHNLRSALDHLAYQLAIVGSPGAEPGRQVEFPIAKDLATYESDKPRKVKGMRPEAVRAIDLLKPYHGGTEAFWRIHELNNIDKHRMLFSIGRDVLLDADWIGEHPYRLKRGDPPFIGVFESAVEKEIDLRTSEVFGDPQILQRNTLLPTLKELVNFVDEHVRQFRPLLQ